MLIMELVEVVATNNLKNHSKICRGGDKGWEQFNHNYLLPTLKANKALSK